MGTDRRTVESIDRNKAIGYLVARAMAAEVFGNKERCRAFTEAAHILRTMPSNDDPKNPLDDKAPRPARSVAAGRPGP